MVFQISDKLRNKFAKRIAYAKKFISLREGKNLTTGETYQIPNYGDGLQQKVAKMIFKEMEELGYSNKECLEIWDKESGVGEAYARRFLCSNQKGMQVWEFEHLLKTFNFAINIKFMGEKRFVHSIERNRLIIRCRKHPAFHINFNIDNFRDFEVEYENKEEATNLGPIRMTKIFKQMMEYYFFETARKKIYPFSYHTIRKIFQHKYGLMKLKGEED